MVQWHSLQNIRLVISVTEIAKHIVACHKHENHTKNVSTQILILLPPVIIKRYSSIKGVRSVIKGIQELRVVERKSRQMF